MDVNACPYCGSPAKHEQLVGGKEAVLCANRKCHACGPLRNSKRGAIIAWNSRIVACNDCGGDVHADEYRCIHCGTSILEPEVNDG